MSFKAKYITGFNEQGIHLTEHDLNMLLFLYEHRLLTQSQLFEFYCLSSKQTYNYKSFCNRMIKLEKVGIIKRTRYDLIRRNGIFMYLVELERKGIDVLYICGYLEKTYSQRIPTGNHEHFLGIKQSIIGAYKALSDDPYGFWIGVSTGRDSSSKVNDYVYVFDKERIKGATGISSRSEKEVLSIFKSDEFGSNLEQPRQRIENQLSIYKRSAPTSYGHITNYFRDKGYPDDFVKGLYPDWMIVRNKKVYDFEFDTGSETFETLLKKIVNYMELNKKDEFEHTVFIISLDDSITLRNVTDIQANRLSVLKDKIITGTIEKRDKEDGKLKSYPVTKDYSFISDDLEVYVFPLGRTEEILRTVMNKTKNNGKKSDDIKVCEEFFNQNKNRLILEQLTDIKQWARYDIYRKKYDDYEVPDILECNKFDEPMALLPFYLQEGNVRLMDKFRYFGYKIHNGTEFRSGYTKAIGIYKTKDEMVHDILSDEVIENEDALLFYCLDEQKFYDVINREEVELKNPNL